jgi:hypothetical protein
MSKSVCHGCAEPATQATGPLVTRADYFWHEGCWATVHDQTAHDDQCEIRPGGEYHGRTIGGDASHDPMQIPCHCAARADGRQAAERDIAIAATGHADGRVPLEGTHCLGDCAACDRETPATSYDRNADRATREQEDARSDFIDELAEQFSRLIRAGVPEDQIRADFEACLSLQVFTDPS